MKTRRDFIKISALGTAGIAVAASSFSYAKGSGLFAKDATQSLDDSDLQRTPTYCEVCFWKCAGWTYTNSTNEIVKILGNDEDPHCNGRLCPRGTGGVGMYHDKDRLKTPLIRVKKEDGKSTFREASWDEAFDFVAANMKKVGAEYGPESIALFNHGSSGHHMGHLLQAFGSSNIVAPSYAQCRGREKWALVQLLVQKLGLPNLLISATLSVWY